MIVAARFIGDPRASSRAATAPFAKTFLAAFSWLVVLASTLAPVAAAEFTIKDAQVLGRTLEFVGEGRTGPASVGVAFSPAVANSRSAAERVHAVIGDGLPTGRVRLQALLIPVDRLASVSGLDALYVPMDLPDSMSAVTSAAQRMHIPIISADLTCVQAGHCVVGFASEPTVQIVISRAAADFVGVRFVPAFRMLVREQ